MQDPGGIFLWLVKRHPVGFAKQNTGNKRFGWWMPRLILGLTSEAYNFYWMKYPTMCKKETNNMYKIA